MKIKLKTMVQKVLEDNPETRNSDIALTIEIWKRYYPEKTIGGECSAVRFSELYDLPREDNIKRYRAEYNSKGEYLPTDIKVAVARGINEDVWRRKLGYPMSKYTVHPTKRPSGLYPNRLFNAGYTKPDD